MSRQVLTLRVAVDLLVCSRCKTSGLCEPSRLDRIIDPASAGIEADYSSSGGLPRGWHDIDITDHHGRGSTSAYVMCLACADALAAFLAAFVESEAVT